MSLDGLLTIFLTFHLLVKETLLKTLEFSGTILSKKSDLECVSMLKHRGSGAEKQKHWARILQFTYFSTYLLNSYRFKSTDCYDCSIRVFFDLSVVYNVLVNSGVLAVHLYYQTPWVQA